MKISIITLGCKVNQYESNAMSNTLLNKGYEVTEKLEFADAYILNTCAVTNEAEKKSRGLIAKVKKLNKNAKIFVCGCASQNNPNQFLKNKSVTAVIGNAGKNKVEELLKFVGDKTISLPMSYENFTYHNTTKTRAYLKVQDGCNNFCSYCLIPYVRGRSRSRNICEIIKEANFASKTNKEIVSTGINISDFKIDGELALPKLMLSLKELPSRIRIGSLEVNVITEEFLTVLKSMPNFCPQFHLSLQSGSNKILKQMNRHYTKEQFLEKVSLIRKFFPLASITTDVIVGFPTETQQDFLESLETIKKAEFYFIHIFPYSVRNGTQASKLPLLDGNTVKNRVKMLMVLNEQLKTEYLCKMKDKEQIVLTENIENGFMVGHTENFIKVYLPSQTPRHKLINVVITTPYLDGALANIKRS